MSNTKTSPKRRNADLAMIHMAGKRLFGDVSKGGDGREDYEDWLEAKTGKRSSSTLTTPERIDLLKALRKDGLLAERKRGGTGRTVGGEDRPTEQQWNKIGGLARDIGWDRGLGDARLHAFAERTAKIANARFLTRSQASKVILGLEAWARQQNSKDAQ
jgi:hypothetical protein